MVDEFSEEDKKSFVEINNQKSFSGRQIKNRLVDYLMKREIGGTGNRVDLQQLSKLVMKSQLKVSIKRSLLEYIKANDDNAVEYLRKLVFDVLDAKSAVKEADKEEQIENWIDKLTEKVDPSLSSYTTDQIDLAVGLIIYEQYERDGSYRKLFQAYKRLLENKRGMV